MTCLEHYFENLLYNDEDCLDNVNKNQLSKEEQEAVEICYQYVLYTMFGSRENLDKFLKENEDF